MKTLNTYINEWKANTNTVSSIKKTQYFIYKTDHRQKIKIFDIRWEQLKDYKDKVYMNGEQIAIGPDGWTANEYELGVYKFEIKDIDNVTTCLYMFYDCTQLIEVPLFDTSKVEDMYKMFKHCKNLKKVPLFDTNNVKAMSEMFYDCSALSDETKKAWSKVYNFDTNKRI